MRHNWRLGAVAAPVVVASMLLTACGGDDSRSSSSSAGAASTPAKKDVIRWGQAVYSGAYWGLYAGQKEGFFDKADVDLKIRIIPSSPNIVSAAEGGSLDMFAVATDSAVAGISQGATIKVGGGIHNRAAPQF